MWHSRTNGSSEPDRESSPSTDRASDGDGADGSLRRRRGGGKGGAPVAGRGSGSGRRWWDPTWGGREEARGDAEDRIALELALAESRATAPVATRAWLSLLESEAAPPPWQPPSAPGGIDLTADETAALRANRWPSIAEWGARQALAEPEAAGPHTTSERVSARLATADIRNAFPQTTSAPAAASEGVARPARVARLPVQPSETIRWRGEANWVRLVRTHSRARFVRRLSAVLLAHVGTWSRLH